MSDNGHAGKGERIEAALARYESPLTRYAHRITGDAERARDVVQETFLRLCSNEHAPQDGHLTRWLFTVCRNHALDVLRKERRMTTLAEMEVTETGGENPPDLETRQREQSNRIEQCLDELPHNQRQVLRLKFGESLSYREISRRTGLSVSNVGYLMHRGIKTLRRRLKDSRD